MLEKGCVPPRKSRIQDTGTRMHFPRKVPAPAERLERYSREPTRALLPWNRPLFAERRSTAFLKEYKLAWCRQ